jgi:hypothetical protein
MAAPEASAVSRERVERGVVDPLLDMSFPEDEDDEDEDGAGGANASAPEPALTVDWDAVCEWLFSRGADAATSDTAREVMYKARRRVLNRRKRHTKKVRCASSITTI